MKFFAYQTSRGEEHGWEFELNKLENLITWIKRQKHAVIIYDEPKNDTIFLEIYDTYRE